MFNWDADKHDSQIPERPELIKVKAICPCGFDEFILVHRVNLITYGNQRSIEFEQPPALICAKCSTATPREKLIEMVKNVGKGTSKPTLVKTTPHPQ